MESNKRAKLHDRLAIWPRRAERSRPSKVKAACPARHRVPKTVSRPVPQVVPEKHYRRTTLRTPIMKHRPVDIAHRDEPEAPFLPEIRNRVKEQAGRAELHSETTSRSMVDPQRQNPIGIAGWIMAFKQNALVLREHSPAQLI
jgi:hypothetical protein